MDINNIKKGHMGMLVWTDENGHATWCYCVAKHVFDDRVEFLKNHNQGNYVHVFNTVEDEGSIIGSKNQKFDSYLTMLTVNGQPAVSKKTIFGKYAFKTT